MSGLSGVGGDAGGAGAGGAEVACAGAGGGSEPLLRVEGLHVTYRVRGGAFEALHDISFELAPREVLGVVGESGCGKSTLSSAIMRLLPRNGRVSRGRVLLAGVDVVSLSDEKLRRLRGRRIGMIFQDPLTSLNPTFRVATQMVTAQRAHGLGRDDRDRRRVAEAMLERVGIPDASRRADAYPHEFSGGMRQRIMIATALLLEPELLICDEATSALDVTLQAQILELLRELCRERGTALIVISHDLGVISDVCERLMVLYAGRAVETGSVADVLREPQHPYTRRLVSAVPSRHRRTERLATIPGRVPDLSALPQGCTFADRCDLVWDACRAEEPALLDLGRRQVRCLVYADGDEGVGGVAGGGAEHDGALGDVDGGGAQDADGGAAAVGGPAVVPEGSGSDAAGGPLLRVEGLRTHFPERRGLVQVLRRAQPQVVRAVDDVSLDVSRGEAVGLVGESGSGKTTLGKAVLGLAPVSGGQVTFDGQALGDLDDRGWRGLRRRMQMIMQEPYGSLSPRLRVAQLITEPYRINRVPAAERYAVDELLEMVGLSAEQATKYPHELSGGQARRVGIARALAVRPDFIVADEPTAGLDVSAAASVLNLLRNLRVELRLSYLIITHDLNLVGYVADRIMVMYLGKVVESGTADEVLSNPQHPYTQALLAAVPDPAAEGGRRIAATMAGEIPSPRNPPSGCRFRTRCPFAEARCAEDAPPLPADGVGAACHFWEEIAAGTKPRTGSAAGGERLLTP